MSTVASNGQSDKSTVHVVVGASGGVGVALVRRLKAHGATTVLVGRDEEKIAAVADQFESPYMIADAANFADISKCLGDCLTKYGRIDGVACVAGSILLKPAHLTTEAEWNSVVAANLTSAFSVVSAAAKAMRQFGGSIALVSSVAARLGLPNHDAVSAAKAGVEGLVRSAAASYAKYKVRVNCVAPGMLDTKLIASLSKNQAILQAQIETYPLMRIGKPEDIASLLYWLLSDESMWVTGQCFSVDGGFSSVRTSPRVTVSESALAPVTQ